MKDGHDRTILVSGATGQQGGAVARHLLAGGFRVRALTRDGDQAAARALAERGVEIAEGDFDDRTSLDAALDGAYGAFSVQTFFGVGVDAERRHGVAFADAAADAGVAHFVYSSVGAAERDTGIPHFESKWAIEEHVRRLDLPATILRPAAFMENWPLLLAEPIRSGHLPQPLSPETRLQQVAVDDIGTFAAIAFSDPDQWVGRALELAGDDPTMAEMAEAFGRSLGRPVEYVQVPWEEFHEAAGEEATLMYRFFEERGYAADIPRLREIHPGLVDFETFLRTVELGGA